MYADALLRFSWFILTPFRSPLSSLQFKLLNNCFSHAFFMAKVHISKHASLYYPALDTLWNWCVKFDIQMRVKAHAKICINYRKHWKSYRIPAKSFRGNYSFLNLALCTAETIQGRKLFAEIRYIGFQLSGQTGWFLVVMKKILDGIFLMFSGAIFLSVRTKKVA